MGVQGPSRAFMGTHGNAMAAQWGFMALPLVFMAPTVMACHEKCHVITMKASRGNAMKGLMVLPWDYHRSAMVLLTLKLTVTQILCAHDRKCVLVAGHGACRVTCHDIARYCPDAWHGSCRSIVMALPWTFMAVPWAFMTGPRQYHARRQCHGSARLIPR